MSHVLLVGSLQSLGVYTLFKWVVLLSSGILTMITFNSVMLFCFLRSDTSSTEIGLPGRVSSLSISPGNYFTSSIITCQKSINFFSINFQVTIDFPGF